MCVCVCKVLIFTISLFWEKLSLELEVGRGRLEGLYIIIMLMSFQEAGELSVEPETIVHVFTYIITVRLCSARESWRTARRWCRRWE